MQDEIFIPRFEETGYGVAADIDTAFGRRMCKQSLNYYAVVIASYLCAPERKLLKVALQVGIDRYIRELKDRE